MNNDLQKLAHLDKLIRYYLRAPIRRIHAKDLLSKSLDYVSFISRICRPEDYRSVLSFLITWRSILESYFGIHYPAKFGRPLSNREIVEEKASLKSYWYDIMREIGVEKTRSVGRNKLQKIIIAPYQDTILPLVFDGIYSEYLRVPIRFKVSPWDRYLEMLVLEEGSLGGIHNLSLIYKQLFRRVAKIEKRRLIMYKALFLCGGHSIFISRKRLLKKGFSADYIEKYLNDPNVLFSEMDTKKILKGIKATVDLDTDHEYVLRRTLRANGVRELDVKYRDSSEGIKLFLDGKVDLFCGGLSFAYPFLYEYLRAVAIPLYKKAEGIRKGPGSTIMPNIDGLVTFEQKISEQQGLLNDLSHSWFIMIRLLKELIDRFEQGDKLASRSMVHIIRTMNYYGSFNYLDIQNLVRLYDFNPSDIYDRTFDGFFTSIDRMCIHMEDLSNQWNAMKVAFRRDEDEMFKTAHSASDRDDITIDENTYNRAVIEVMKVDLDEVVHSNAFSLERLV